MTHIQLQGHKVTYSNCNNSSADCSTVPKFGTEFDHGTAGTIQCSRSQVKGHWAKGQGRSVT